MVWLIEVSRDGGKTWKPKTPFSIGMRGSQNRQLAAKMNHEIEALAQGHKYKHLLFRSAPYSPLAMEMPDVDWPELTRLIKAMGATSQAHIDAVNACRLFLEAHCG